MSAPTFGNGLERSTQLFLVPNIALLVMVVFSLEFWGTVIVGLLYLLAVAVTLLNLVASAKYWNSEYTAGFVLGSLFWIGLIPGVTTSLINPGTAVLVVIVQFIAVAAIGGLKLVD